MSVPFERLADPGQSVAAYVEKKWGGPIRALPLVGYNAVNNPVRGLLNNPRRFLWAFFNTGSASVYIDQTGNLSVLTSILVSPLGGSVISLVDEDGEFTTQELWFATAGGSSTVSILEIIRK